MSDKAYLLCLRVTDAGYSQVIRGSTKGLCSVCKHSVYISPESLKVKEQSGAVVLCMQCSLDYIRTNGNGNPETFVITTAQIEEAKKAKEQKSDDIQRN